MNWKWMMMAGVLAASLAFAACGDDDDDDNLPPCDVTADCATGEVCVGADGAKVCRVGCSDDTDCTGGRICRNDELDPNGPLACFRDTTGGACEEDFDCEEGQFCIEGTCQEPASCEDDTDCLEGEVCDETGACVPDEGGACTTTAECVEETAICAQATSECVDASCSATWNTCERCTLGPNGGDRAANGPLVFPAQTTQVGTCVQDTSRCAPGGAPWACEFAFLAIDLDGDLPTSGLNGDSGKIRVLSGSGNESGIFGATQNVDATTGFTRYTFQACFPDTSSGNIGTAVFVRDDANNASNTLCINGSLPTN